VASSRVHKRCVGSDELLSYLRRRHTIMATGTSSHSSEPPEPVCEMLHPSWSAPPPLGAALVRVAVDVGGTVFVRVGVAVFGSGVLVGVAVLLGVGVAVAVTAGVGAGAQMPSTQTRSGGVGQGFSVLQVTMVQAPGGVTQMPCGQSASVVHPGSAVQVPVPSTLTHTESAGQSLWSLHS
jgi:hypothetical protein